MNSQIRKNRILNLLLLAIVLLINLIDTNKEYEQIIFVLTIMYATSKTAFYFMLASLYLNRELNKLQIVFYIYFLISFNCMKESLYYKRINL